MSKDTLRDTVWREVIKQRDRGNSMVKPDIQKQVAAGDRTVHDVLQTAVEYGLLDRSTTVEDRNDPRTTSGSQKKEVAVFEPTEVNENQIDDDTAPVNDEEFSEDIDTTDSDSIEDDVDSTSPVSDSNNTETRSIPETDLDDDGFIDEDWPDASAGHYAANFEGVGSRKATRLYDRYKGYEDIIKAPVEEMTTIEGVGRSTAEDMKYKLMKLSFNDTEIDAEDVPEVETEALANMFNAPEDVAEMFQSQLLMHRDVYHNTSVE